MAAHLGQSMVSRVWRAFGLTPHKQDSWKLSKDPLFVAKVRNVVRLYLNPPEQALVLCVDAKTQIQALNRTQPVFPMLPGTSARASHDYIRHGTSSLYAALDLTRGKVIGALHSRHRATEYLAFLNKFNAEVPDELDRAPGPRQRLLARDFCGKALADKLSQIHPALHPDEFPMAQPRSTLVRPTDHQKTAPQHPHLGPTTQRRYPRVDRYLEGQPQAIRLDNNRRPNLASIAN